MPFFKFNFYKNNKQKIKNFEGANNYYKNSLSLPLFYEIKEREINKICNFLINR